jgi:ACR3 family arsenite transporter
MSALTADAPPAAPAMGVFERYLTLWVALCIIAGIALGRTVPGVFAAFGDATVAQVNLPVAGLVWLMIILTLLKIDPLARREAAGHWLSIDATVGPKVRRAQGWYEQA